MPAGWRWELGATGIKAIEKDKHWGSLPNLEWNKTPLGRKIGQPLGRGIEREGGEIIMRPNKDRTKHSSGRADSKSKD